MSDFKKYLKRQIDELLTPSLQKVADQTVSKGDIAQTVTRTKDMVFVITTAALLLLIVTVRRK